MDNTSTHRVSFQHNNKNAEHCSQRRKKATHHDSVRSKKRALTLVHSAKPAIQLGMKETFFPLPGR